MLFRSGLRTEVGNIKNPLSIGQLRKIALARALIKDAQLIILDEPTASIDDISEVQIQKVIEEQAKAGKGILLITHREALISGSQKLTDMARVR